MFVCFVFKSAMEVMAPEGRLREQSRAGGRGAVIIYLCVEVMILTQQSEM